eukprot:6192451-Pleurochrysis_carterae.AAC.1
MVQGKNVRSKKEAVMANACEEPMRPKQQRLSRKLQNEPSCQAEGCAAGDTAVIGLRTSLAASANISAAATATLIGSAPPSWIARDIRPQQQSIQR